MKKNSWVRIPPEPPNVYFLPHIVCDITSQKVWQQWRGEEGRPLRGQSESGEEGQPLRGQGERGEGMPTTD